MEAISKSEALRLKKRLNSPLSSSNSQRAKLTQGDLAGQMRTVLRPCRMFAMSLSGELLPRYRRFNL